MSKYAAGGPSTSLDLPSWETVVAWPQGIRLLFGCNAPSDRHIISGQTRHRSLSAALAKWHLRECVFGGKTSQPAIE